MPARRKKPKDHAAEVYDEYLDEEDDDGTEELESEETEGSQLPPSRNRRKAGRGAEGEDDATDEDTADTDEEEEVNDPVAKAVADAEARMRHKYIKPMKAELARLKRDAGNAGAAVATVRSLRLENEFLRLAGGSFHDADAAFRLADVSQVDLADDGTITGMDEAVEAVAEAHPYLVRDDLAEDDEDWEPPDLPSGRPTNGRRKSGDQATSDAVLRKRYPALQNRRGW